MSSLLGGVDQAAGDPAGAPAVDGVQAGVTLVGWLDEGVQALLPSRTYDLRDVAFNAVAAVTAVGVMARARKLGRRWRSPSAPT